MVHVFSSFAGARSKLGFAAWEDEGWVSTQPPTSCLGSLLLFRWEAVRPIRVPAPPVGSCSPMPSRFPAPFCQLVVDGFGSGYPLWILGHHRCLPYPCRHRFLTKGLFRTCLVSWRHVPVCSPPLCGGFLLHGYSGALQSHQNMVLVCSVWSGLLVNVTPE